MIFIVNNYICQLLYVIYPLVNLILYIDLIWILKNPFYPQRQRNFYYYILIAILTVFSISHTTILLQFTQKDQEVRFIYLRHIPDSIHLILRVMNLLSIFFIAFLLLKESLSKKLRQIILVRYIILFITFIPGILAPCYTTYLYLSSSHKMKDQSDDSTYRLLMNFSLYLVVMVPLVRLCEPRIIYALKQSLNSKLPKRFQFKLDVTECS